MAIYEKHEGRLRVLLEHLSVRGAQRHSELMQVWIKQNGTLASFTHALNWLKRKGYVQKKDPSCRTTPYDITENGRKYLDGLRA